jgi:hypothetical protein
MTQLPVSFPELVELLRALGPVQAADCNPKALRALLLAQLDTTEPALAKRVRQFRADHMEVLCEYVLLGVKLAGRPAR